MDPEGARLLTCSNVCGKPSMLSVYFKYSSLCSTAHRAAGPLRWKLGYTHCACSEGSMSSFKCVCHTALKGYLTLLKNRFRLPHCRLTPSLQGTPANIHIKLIL